MTIYETYVIKNPTSKNIERELAGGHVTAWSTGHQLRILGVYRKALEKIATGELTSPCEFANRFLNRLDTYENSCDTKAREENKNV